MIKTTILTAKMAIYQPRRRNGTKRMHLDEILIREAQETAEVISALQAPRQLLK